MDDWVIWMAIGLLAVALLALAVRILIAAALVAASLFSWASDWGFPGIALYIILWVVALPVMILFCLIVGALFAFGVIQPSSGPTIEILKAYQAERRKEQARLEKPMPKFGTPAYFQWANREGPYADG
ncbi:hypothetical protein [uncultured Rhodospira sp.]|uniref:hypothetical protein n=1 Tax=uncultured Rhodospira sp. TaxID=1936189 RepID=UPI0026245C08|nr:hypothetical protein [uncultured Rhodospira sp.]